MLKGKMMSNDLVTKVRGALESPNSQAKLLSFFGDDKAKVTKFKSALITIVGLEMLM